MGFSRNPRVYNLVFQGEFEGLNVQVAGLPVGDFLTLSKLFEDAESGSMTSVERVFQIFGVKLRGWNLEDENGKPVPATVEGMKSQELDLVLAVISHWVEAMSGVDVELGKGSRSGVISPELELPMEAL